MSKVNSFDKSSRTIKYLYYTIAFQTMEMLVVSFVRHVFEEEIRQNHIVHFWSKIKMWTKSRRDLQSSGVTRNLRVRGLSLPTISNFFRVLRTKKAQTFSFSVHACFYHSCHGNSSSCWFFEQNLKFLRRFHSFLYFLYILCGFFAAYSKF